jgi:hypothetical protein
VFSFWGLLNDECFDWAFVPYIAFVWLYIVIFKAGFGLSWGTLKAEEPGWLILLTLGCFILEGLSLGVILGSTL